MSDVIIIIIVMITVMIAVAIAVAVVVVVIIFSIDTTFLHPALLGSLFGVSLFYDIAL